MPYCCSFVEILEARIAPATLYVGKDYSFTITNDVGPAGLSAGDTVTWNPGSGSGHAAAVEGLVFGVNAFSSVGTAVTATNPEGGDIVRVGPGTFTEQVIVTHSLQLLGNQVGVDARGRSPISETIMNNAGGSLVITADDVLVDGFLFEGQRDAMHTGAAVSVGANKSGFQLQNSILRDNGTALDWSNDTGGTSIVRHNWFVENSKGEFGVGNAIRSGWGLVDAQLLENRFSGAHGVNTVILSKGLQGGSNIFVKGNEFLDGNSLVVQEINGFYVSENTFSGVQTGLQYGPSEALRVHGGAGQVQENSFTDLGVAAIVASGDFNPWLLIDYNTINQDIGLYNGSHAAIAIVLAKGNITVFQNAVTFSGEENGGSTVTSALSISGDKSYTVSVTRNVFDASAVQFNEETVYRSTAVDIVGYADALQTIHLGENVFSGWEVGLQTSGLDGGATVSAWGNNFSGNHWKAITNQGSNPVDARFSWFGESKTKSVAETVIGNVNTGSFATTGEDQSAAIAGFQSAAVLDLRKPGNAIFTDIDGDRVVVRSSRGAFEWEDFQLEPSANGFHLSRLILDNGFSDAVISVTADKRKSTGDGFVAVTSVDAVGVDLRSLTINGDLETLRAGDDDFTTPGLSKLTVRSFGFAEAADEGGGGVHVSRIRGALGKLIVRDSMIGVSLRVDGSSETGIGQIAIGGNLVGNSNSGSGVISTSGDIGSVKIGGSMIAHSGLSSASIVAGGTIGSVSIGHDLWGDRAADSGRIIAGTTIGTVAVGGSLSGALISAGGVASPKNAAEALAIRGVTVGGDVLDSRILAGFVDHVLARSDVQIGSIKVKGGWQTSDVSAGIESGDSYFGNGDDAATFAGDNAIVSRIAKVVIGGIIAGTFNTNDSYGFVAEQIGSFQNGARRIGLTSAEGEVFSLGRNADAVVREI